MIKQCPEGADLPRELEELWWMIATRQAKTLRVVVLQNAESLQSQADWGGVLIAVALKVYQLCDLAHPCSTSMGAAVVCLHGAACLYAC